MSKLPRNFCAAAVALTSVLVLAGCAGVTVEPKSPDCMFWTLVTHGFSGCASHKLAPDADDAQAKRFTPSPGKASVYVARPGLYGSRDPWLVQVDRKTAGISVYDTYVFQEVEPGRHRVHVATQESQDFVDIDAQADHNYFIKTSARLGFAYPRADVLLVGEEEGRNMIRALRRVGPLQ